MINTQRIVMNNNPIDLEEINKNFSEEEIYIFSCMIILDDTPQNIHDELMFPILKCLLKL